jgi:pseudouridylate synthase
MALERLDKCLVKLGVGSRSEVKTYILNGRVKVNGLVVNRPETKADSLKDVINFDGKSFALEEFVYYIINKPKDCICALKDNKHKTVMEYLDDRRKGLVPVGRLDIDTEGLLLITDDGALNHRLLSPAHHVPKVYYALIEGSLPEDAADKFLEGIELDDGPTKPAYLKIIEKNSEGAKVELTISEGRFHQVKRMFAALSCKVVYLKRTAFAGIILDENELKPGEYRKLTKEETDALKAF